MRCIVARGWDMETMDRRTREGEAFVKVEGGRAVDPCVWKDGVEGEQVGRDLLVPFADT